MTEHDLLDRLLAVLDEALVEAAERDERALAAAARESARLIAELGRGASAADPRLPSARARLEAIVASLLRARDEAAAALARVRATSHGLGAYREPTHHGGTLDLRG